MDYGDSKPKLIFQQNLELLKGYAITAYFTYLVEVTFSEVHTKAEWLCPLPVGSQPLYIIKHKGSSYKMSVAPEG